MATYKVPYSGVSNRLGQEEIESIVTALQQDTLAYGPLTDRFESEFAQSIGARHALTTCSGTVALYLATQVLGLEEGDEVITTPQTFWGAVWPLLARRCVVRFADIDPDTLNLDPASVERLITKRTKAIYALHYGGQAADMDPILALARAHRLRVVEDCAHVPGGRYKGRSLGTLGDLGCFSFQSLKNMTTGEGGMLVTNDDELHARARALGRIGSWGETVARAEHSLGPYGEPAHLRRMFPRSAFREDFANDRFAVGSNYRMSELQSAVGLVQLRKLDSLNQRRQSIAERLNRGIAAIPGMTVQGSNEYANHVYHLYTCFFEPAVVGGTKEDFIRYLDEEEGIQIQLRFFPVHLVPELRAFGHGVGECPVAEEVYFDRQIQLPIYDHLTDDQVGHMIDGVRRAVERVGRPEGAGHRAMAAG